jgi:CHAD domain-containing protein
MPRATTGRTIDIAAVLRADLEQFRQTARLATRRPTADRVHDARVATRRLRADLWLIPKPRRTRVMRKARRDLEVLAAVLGEQRKYDVALEDAKRLDRPTRAIKEHRIVARRAVVKLLRSDIARRCQRRIRRSIRDAAALPPAALDVRIHVLCERLERARRRPPRTNTGRHRLRIDVKKARYLLDAGRHPLGGLATLQDRLGRWHDLMVFSELSGRHRDVIAACRREWRMAERHLEPALRRAIPRLRSLMMAPMSTS